MINLKIGRTKVPYPDTYEQTQLTQEEIQQYYGQGPVFTAPPNLYKQGLQPVVRKSLKDPRAAQRWATQRGYSAYSNQDWDGDGVNDVVVVGNGGVQAFNGYTTAKNQWPTDQEYYSGHRDERGTRKDFVDKKAGKPKNARSLFNGIIKSIWDNYYSNFRPGEVKLNFITFLAFLYKNTIDYVISPFLAVNTEPGSLDRKVQDRVKSQKDVKEVARQIALELDAAPAEVQSNFERFVYGVLDAQYNGDQVNFSEIQNMLSEHFRGPLIPDEDYAAFYNKVAKAPQFQPADSGVAAAMPVINNPGVYQTPTRQSRQPPQLSASP